MMCSDELKRRLPIDFKGVSRSRRMAYAMTNLLQLLVKVVDKDGIREVEIDDSKPVKSA